MDGAQLLLLITFEIPSGAFVFSFTICSNFAMSLHPIKLIFLLCKLVPNLCRFACLQKTSNKQLKVENKLCPKYACKVCKLCKIQTTYK